jgi:hypothetical protein
MGLPLGQAGPGFGPGIGAFLVCVGYGQDEWLLASSTCHGYILSGLILLG